MTECRAYVLGLLTVAVNRMLALDGLLQNRALVEADMATKAGRVPVLTQQITALRILLEQRETCARVYSEFAEAADRHSGVTKAKKKKRT